MMAGTVTNRLLRRMKDSPRAVVLLGIACMTIAVFAQTAWYPFISFDDDSLIYKNPNVLTGFTWSNVVWAFTATSGASFWHPLTWLSHMADVEVFGLNAGGHHLTSVGLHGLNAILLFLILHGMTGSTWRSGLVAALFAIHPQHVESVAWVAERKDVLSAFFYLLSLWSYVRYAKQPGVRRYSFIVFFLAMSLMSKPMAVTFPFALLLFDWWPLYRIAGMTPGNGEKKVICPPVSWRRVLSEKIPLILLVVGSAIVTLSHESDTPWIMTLSDYPIWVRVSNAVVSYATYLWKTVWPLSLAVFYPHPGTAIEAWKVAAASMFLVGCTIAVIRRRNRFPYLPVGWFFYLGTLVPVIGLVQVSGLGMADRYTYVPLIGIFMIAAWGGEELARGYRHRIFAPAAATVVLIALATEAWVQTGYWKDSITLYARAVELTKRNWTMEYNLGTELLNAGNNAEALVHLKESLSFNPDQADAHINVGSALLGENRTAEAIGHFRAALRIRNDDYRTWMSIAGICSRLGKTELANQGYAEAERRFRLSHRPRSG
jgi:protein O-mannosyl-transferase